MGQRDLLETLCSLDLEERRAWLEGKLREKFEAELEVNIYDWTHDDSPDLLFKGMPALFHGPKESRNFCLRFGAHPERVVVGAHYDVVAGVQGANDNTAAVVQIYQAALAIKALQPEKRPNVTFVFFDWEEKIGTKYMGSKTYLLTHPKPDYALILDVSGKGELYLSSTQTSPSILKEYADEYWQYGTPPSDSMNFIHICETALLCAAPVEELKAGGYLPTWRDIHSSHDSTEKIEDATLTKGTSFILDFIGRKNRKKS